MIEILKKKGSQFITKFIAISFLMTIKFAALYKKFSKHQATESVKSWTLIEKIGVNEKGIFGNDSVIEILLKMHGSH